MVLLYTLYLASFTSVILRGYNIRTQTEGGWQRWMLSAPLVVWFDLMFSGLPFVTVGAGATDVGFLLGRRRSVGASDVGLFLGLGLHLARVVALGTFGCSLERDATHDDVIDIVAAVITH